MSLIKIARLGLYWQQLHLVLLSYSSDKVTPLSILIQTIAQKAFNRCVIRGTPVDASGVNCGVLPYYSPQFLS